MGLLRHINPRSNPDLTEAYAQVAEWYFEFDAQGQEVIRQVGINKENLPILRAPLTGERGENLGFWKDIPIRASDADMIPLEGNRFMGAWDQTRIFYVGLRSLPLANQRA